MIDFSIFCQTLLWQRSIQNIAIFIESLYRFEPLQSRDVQEGDSREVQDQAVEVHPGDTDVCRKLGTPVDPERKVFDVRGQIQVLSVLVRLISRPAE